MASETTKKTSAKTRSTKKETEIESVVDVELTEDKPDVKPAVKPVVKDIDPHMLVTVRNGFQGRLIYKSSRTNERFVWDQFGAEQDMEIGELRNAKNSNKKFFIMNWFMFDEAWIPEYLGMAQYYKHAIPVDNFDEFFDKPASEITAKLKLLSDGQKRSLAYRARQLISEEKIDSNKVISALEKGLGVELVEHYK